MTPSTLRIPLRRGRSRHVQKRKEFFERAASFAPMLAVDTGRRGCFFVRTEDLHVGRSLFVAGTRQEMDTLDLAIELIQSYLGRESLAGTTLVDVGANIGTTTVPALLSGTFERAIAIEPETDNFHTLRLNVQLNQLESRVVAVHAAASSSVGSAHLLVSPRRSGKHRLADPSDKRNEGIEIPSTTVDTLMEREGIRPKDVGLLWMDAEGSEDRVMTGAAAILEERRPIVLELNPLQVKRTGGSQGDLERLINRHYAHFVPLRLDARADAVPRPSEELPALVRALGKGKKLDVLLLDLGAPIASSSAAPVRLPA